MFCITTDAPAVHSLPVKAREQDEEANLSTAYVPGLKAKDLNSQNFEGTMTIEGEYG
jgi:HSP20 family molecular chaperone IbpA